MCRIPRPEIIAIFCYSPPAEANGETETFMPQSEKQTDFNPDEYRMSVGEHLEELRRRLILALIGFALAVVVCMLFGERVMVWFCRPAIQVLQKHHLSTTFNYTELTEPFMTYLKVSLICAAAIGSPWMIYQIWQFVAAGLYPNERRVVTKYIPYSIGLLLLGMAFVYWVVLPLSVTFFIEFSSAIELPIAENHSAQVSTTQPLSQVTPLAGDPARPSEYDMWYDTTQSRLKMFIGGKVKVIPFGPDQMMTPILTIRDYIDLVMSMLLIFGLAFQLPLVIITLVKVGIVEVAWLRKMRKYVYFAMSIVAAVIAPGDVVTTMLALLIPMILLYEVGIVFANWGAGRATGTKAGESGTEA
jgi:sec-independent protein translocase protein TatC